MSTGQEGFFSPTNQAMLNRLLYSDFQRRTGGELTDKQRARLEKTIDHYMEEVASAQQNRGKPVPELNKEVLQAVVPDYMAYLRRNAGPIMDGGREVSPQEEVLRSSVNKRFEQLQAERQEGGRALPAAPDFRLALEDDSAAGKPTPMQRFEAARQQRELEAAREEQLAAALKAAGQRGDTAITDYLNSDAAFRAGRLAATAEEEAALTARGRDRAAAGAAARNELMPVPPDPRQLLFGDGPAGMTTTLARRSGLAATNPTLALPDGVRPRPALPQDIVKPQDDVISYRETEQNLFIYSADRDWVNNTTENRYNFSINFDPANNKPGFGYSPATNIKFKNISRIEFVKAIMATEACDVLTTSTAAGNPLSASNTNLNVNIFNYPYLQVRIPELDTNGHGTNDGLNNAFAVISYDAYWAADTALKNRGYARMIPKFLKCQKVYYPTPLATLQKLTFEIQKPDGTLLCDSKDTLDVSGFYYSSSATTSATYYDASGYWFWISTKTWFSRFQVTQGDRVQFKNVNFSDAFKSGAGSAATTDFINFITRPEGHLVSDIGQINSGGTFKDGPNLLGYANAIIIRGNFQDPTTGTVALKPFGGTSALNTTFKNYLASNPAASSGRFINLNHQVQLIFRIITRDMDAASRLRPDNL